MTKLYLDMTNVSAIPGAYRLDTAGLMSATGVNIGNFAFRHALQMILADFADYRPVTYTGYLKAAEEGPIDRVLVSCANWLGTSAEDDKNNGFRAMVLEKAQGPIECFGLGVQAHAGAAQTELGPNTQRMAKVMAERATALSVRDQRTQDTLEAYGITNTVITGCPSNFINPDRDLGDTVAARARTLATAAPAWGDIRTVISEASGGHAASGDVIAAQLRLMADHPAFYILQSPALLPFLLGENNAIPPAYLSNSPFEDTQSLKQALNRGLMHFSSIDAWMDFARSCHLSFGMRIHGTMVPLQAGVPSVLISHDSRTAGLGAHMGIPTLTPEVYLDHLAQGPAALFGFVAKAMAGYDSRRQGLAQVMRDYVTGNGLQPHADLVGLAE